MHEAPSPAPYQTNCGVALFFLAVLPRTCRLRHLIVSASTPLTDIYPVSRALLVITAGICRDEARHGRPKRDLRDLRALWTWSAEQTGSTIETRISPLG